MYWKALKVSQIRITGNGSLGEHWNHLGNTPVQLTNDLRPNENCVAMGWMKFNADLSLFSGEGKYFDELEKTLYNHIMGSQASDGHDFSYYQGNIGHKIHAKDPGMYSCCRYRGMRILALLPEYIFMQSDDKVAINIFTPSTSSIMVDNTNVMIEQKTSYPKNGKIDIHVKPEKPVQFSLLIRKPEWSESVEIRMNDEKIEYSEENGYLVLDREWSPEGSILNYNIDMTIERIEATINGEKNLAVKYGPLVLAIDSRYNTPIYNTRIGDNKALKPLPIDPSTSIPQVKFETEGYINGNKQMITLVDYASAGSIDAGVDEFRLWLPVNNGN
jgi:DUF1680 family protein